MKQHPEMRLVVRRWQFGSVSLDERNLILQVDGREVEIEPKPLELLRHLLENASLLVTKDALIQAVWPGRIISDSALAKAVARLREAIGDKDQALIRTHHGYGYRLVAAVRVEEIERRSAAVPAKEPVPAQPSPAAVDESPGSDAERRLLTVLFCDLVGSTQLAETLDAEEFRDVLLDYQRRASDICERYEGHVAQRLGDGLLLYFGYPAAHDDDAERAIRCAWDLLSVLTRPGAVPRLSIRIGIHTGAVVVGRSGPGSEVLATGPGLHLTARLQALAEPDSILISEASFRLVPGMFITRDFGPQTLRGLTEAVRVHQVLQPSGVRTRLEAASKLTPFAGREIEISTLSSCWRDAVDGQGQAILVSGEPGLGKSRLLLELRERLSGGAYTWLECRAASLTRHSAYQPIVELLHRGLVINPDDSDEQKLQRLEQGLDTLGLDKTETIPLLAPLLNIGLPERYPASQLGPELRRRRTLEALTAWVQKLAYQQPLLIVFEDLHWADESSLAVLELLLEQIKDQPVLLLMTARTEFVPRWSVQPHLHAQSLEPLPRDDVESMLGDIVQDHALSAELRALIGERAGGVPLFVEELTRALLDSGQLVERERQLALDIPYQQLAIPDSLQGLLMARLDRLGPARDLIQTAAVIGRELSYRLIELVSELVSGIDPIELRGRLQQLTDSGLLHVRGSPPEATYVFKHALIQDAAYDTLLRARRQALHGAIAAALESNFPETAKKEPEVLAAHFEKAQRIESAVRWYGKAAEKSAAACLYAEAIRFCEQALALLPRLAGGLAPDRQELELLVILGNAKIALLGFGNPELGAVMHRTERLSAQVDDVDLKARALGNLSMMRLGTADYAAYEQLGERFLELSTRTGRAMYAAAGHTMVAMACYYSGEPLRSRSHYERAIEAYDDRSSRDAISIFGMDGITCAMVPNAYALWLLGYPDRAVERAHDARARAESTGHAQTIGMVGLVLPETLSIRRELRPVLELAASAAAFAERHGLDGWRAFSLCQLGYAKGMLGQFDEGLGLLNAVIGAMRARRAFNALTHFCCLEAEVCLHGGRTDQAAAALDLVFQMTEERGERHWEAEAYRLRGELMLTRDADAVAAAESHFQKALEVSRAQSAKSLELRAATSLAHLWQRQGRRQDAVELLQPVYAWFSEGFDTPDLKDAAALLTQLSEAGLPLLVRTRRLG